MDNSKITFNPVFIEPTIKHTLLLTYSYIYIIVFELVFVLLLIYIFFYNEIAIFFTPGMTVSNPLNVVKQSKLLCKNNDLYIKLPNYKIVSAISLNGQPISYNKCEELISSLNNGSQ
ncbi:membrane protein [Cetacean poxvirus 1]|nr:membrane protein [Cetacean poxvirus 1]